MSYTDPTSPFFRAVMLGAGLAIIAAALRSASTVANLILLSLLLAGTVSPFPFYLTQKGMNRGLAIAVTAILAIVGGVALILVLAGSLSHLGDNLPQYQASLAGLTEDITARLAARGIEVDQALQPDPARLIGRVGGLIRAGLGMLGYGLLAIVLIVLFLIELPLVDVGDSGAGSLRHRLDEAMRLVRRFVGLNGLIGAVIALINFVIMLAMGTDAPVLWAVIIFLFAFVPFGFVISLIPPFLITLLEHGIGRAGLLALIFFVVNFVGDNVIKPKVMGEGLGLSPLLIVISLLVWGFVLGPMGALLAIPLTLGLRQVLPVFLEPAASAPARY